MVGQLSAPCPRTNAFKKIFHVMFAILNVKCGGIRDKRKMDAISLPLIIPATRIVLNHLFKRSSEFMKTV